MDANRLELIYLRIDAIHSQFDVGEIYWTTELVECVCSANQSQFPLFVLYFYFSQFVSRKTYVPQVVFIT